MRIYYWLASNSGQQARSCDSSITKESGSIYKSTKERVDSRNEWTWRLHLMGSWPKDNDSDA